MLDWMKHKLESRLPREIAITADMQMTPTLMAEIEEELKSLLMRVKAENEKAGLKFNIQKTKIMVSGPITSWQIDGKTMETVADFIFLGSKITTGGDCSYEIKRHLLLGRKAMTNLDRCSALLIVQLSHQYLSPGKTMALTRRTFVVRRVMSLWC